MNLSTIVFTYCLLALSCSFLSFFYQYISFPCIKASPLIFIPPTCPLFHFSISLTFVLVFIMSVYFPFFVFGFASRYYSFTVLYYFPIHVRE